VTDTWQFVRCAPDAYSHPDELGECWCDAAEVAVPASLAAASGTAEPDDYDWWLRCRFEADEPTSVVFRGLTFPAQVFLDGAHVADCESMFLPVAIECGPGSHELTVRCGSLNAWLRTRRPRGRWRSSLVAAPGLRWARTTLIGRAPVYGNIAAAVGIWRPVVKVPVARQTRFTIGADARSGVVRVSGHTGASDGTSVDLEVHSPTGDVGAVASSRVSEGRFDADFRVDSPQLWWPRGYGPQNLYHLTVKLAWEPAGHRCFGFRSVLVTTEQQGFAIHVNGVLVFCRGVTWSPPDALHLNVSQSVMRDHTAAFADAGANMVRVVGGLVYEQDDFWESCAEQGLLVWQDAMLATSDPPPEVSTLIARELASVLDSVSGNPALVVVSGGSETLQQPEMLGMSPADSPIDVIDTLLPDVVATHSDAHYVRSSPSQPPGDTTTSEGLAIRPDTGVAHWFGVGGYLRPIADVRSAGVSFAAECLAFANPPIPEAVERHFGSAAVAGHDPRWKAGVPRDRGSSWDFEDVRDFYVGQVFGEDLLATRRVDPERYLQLGRLAIAEAMRECFAYWRQADSRCAGALVLAAKDACPGAGWGLLDVDGAPKPALAVLARVWAPIAVVLGDAGLSGIRVDVHNDTADPLHGELVLIATNAVGVRTVEVTRDIVIEGHSSLTHTDTELSGVFRDLSHAFRFGPPVADAVEATARFDGVPRVVRDVLVVYPRPGQVRAGLTAIATQRGELCWELRVASDVALRYVCIDAPGWAPSDNYFHLVADCPYALELTRLGESAKPSGTVSSIDLLSKTSIGTAP
jgi:beta-mannosidase